MNIPMEKIKLIIGLVLAVAIPALFGEYIPVYIKAASYSLSFTFKQILLLVLPFVIFSFVFSCLLSFKSGALKLVFLLIVCVFISNITAIYVGYAVGTFFNEVFQASSQIPINNHDGLNPTWNLGISHLISNKQALFAGFFFGIIFSVKRNEKIQKISVTLNYYANFFLKKIFMPIMPIFILGFVFKLEHDQMLSKALTVYRPFFIVIVGTQICYMIFIYNVAANFNIKKAFGYIKNVLPATITGLTTISSAASMPVLILGSQKNTDYEMAERIIPATINIHTLGSAIGVTILTVTTLKMFHMPLDIKSFFIFSVYYALAKFAVAAVPGGVIVVAYPLLEEYLGFTPDMLGLITAMYMLFDPFGTATNVTGNGAFVIIFNKLVKKFLKIDKSEEAVT